MSLIPKDALYIFLIIFFKNGIVWFCFLERIPCDPDPCNGGQCIAMSQLGAEVCDCSDTLLAGPHCQLSTLRTPTISVLTEGQNSDSILLQTQPGESLKVVVISNSEFVLINRNQVPVSLTMPTETGRSTFSVLPQQKGLYSLSYSMRSSSLSVIPEDSPILVLPQNASEHTQNNYFTSQRLVPGNLAVGCCQHDYNLPMSVCPTDLMLKSTCMWTTSPMSGVSASTGGVVFMTADDIELPLSIAGVQLLFSNESSSTGIVEIGSNADLQTCNPQCQPTNRESAETCSITDRSVRFDEYDMQDMLEQNSLLSTFVAEMALFLPSWLAIQVLSGLDDKKYAAYDFKAYFGFQDDLQNLKGCGSIVPTSAMAMYALRTDATLQITVEPVHFSVIVTPSNSLCFVVDICDSFKPTLTAPFPPSLATISYIEQLTVKGWNVRPTSVTFAKGGISKATELPYRTIWDGHENREISLPNYDFEMAATFTGSLTGGGTAAEMAFDGSVLYKVYTEGHEVRH